MYIDENTFKIYLSDVGILTNMSEIKFPDIMLDNTFIYSGNNVRSVSLNMYMNEYKPKYAIRFSTRNFGFENNIKSIPLYAIFCIK